MSGLEDTICEMLEPINAFMSLFEIFGRGSVEVDEEGFLQLSILANVAEEQLQKNIRNLMGGIRQKLGEIEIETRERHRIGFFEEADVEEVKLNGKEGGEQA